MARTLTAIAKSKLVLENFGTDAWKKTKDSEFTKLISNVLGCQSEAEHNGEKRAHEKATGHLRGLHFGKAFLKKHREWVKSHMKHKYFMDMIDTAVKFGEFLASESITSSISFGALYVSSRFFKHVRDSNDTSSFLSAGIQDIFQDARMHIWMPGESDDPRTFEVAHRTADAWLRHIFWKALEVVFSKDSHCEECTTTDLRHFERDIDSCRERISNDWPAKESVEDFVEDLVSFVDYLRSAYDPPEVSAKSALDAHNALKNDRVDRIMETFHNSKLGEFVAKQAGAYIAGNEKDTIADKRAESSLLYIRDKHMPKFEHHPGDEEGHVIIFNWSSINDMSCFGTLTESVACLQEAIGMWSTIRKTTSAHTFESWVKCVLDNISCADFSLSANLFGTALQSGALTLKVNEEATDFVTIGSLLLSYDAVCKQMKDAEIDEEPFEEFLTLFSKTVAILQTTLNTELEIFLVTPFVESVQNNIRTRGYIINLFKAIAAINGTALPTSQQDAVAEFQSKFEKQKHETSFLHNAVQLMKAAKKLGEAPRLRHVREQLRRPCGCRHLCLVRPFPEGREEREGMPQDARCGYPPRANHEPEYCDEAHREHARFQRQPPHGVADTRVHRRSHQPRSGE